MAFEYPAPHGVAISDDPARLQLGVIHGVLRDSYWARGRPAEHTERAIAHSLCLGAYAPDGGQVGFLRLVTDRAIRAHLTDVFVLADWRGRGLGRALVAACLAHPELASVSVWTLRTDDAHGLYAAFGFETQQGDGKDMIYRRQSPG